VAVVNPPWLQNSGSVNTAEQARNQVGILIAGNKSALSLVPRQGVHPSIGNTLQVTQSAAPAMSVVVKSGQASIAGTEGAKQGAYMVMNDADVTLTIAAAHATLNRIDSVIFKVEDQAYSGSNNTSSLVVVTGTPAGSPSPPTLPANCIELARVSVVALDTQITNGEITDMRQYMSAVGGLMVVATKAIRDALTGLYDGFAVYRQDIDAINIWNGTEWKFYGVPNNAGLVVTSQTTTSTTYADLATVGPTATIEHGTSVEVTIGAQILNSTNTISALMSFAISGANTRAATDDVAVGISNNTLIWGSRTVLLTGLTPGVSTFTAKYRVNGGSTLTAQDRRIHAKAI